jgi:predicted nucleotidyltransferase
MSNVKIPVAEAELAAFCRANGVARLSVFGSVLRADFNHDHSDIDVLVEFMPTSRRSLFKLLKMEAALSEMFGRKVDLNTAGSLSKYFRDDVVAAAEVIYDAA